MHPEIKNLKKIHVQQQGQSDCGVACLLSILKYYGGNETLENLRGLSGTNITGTTLLGLHQAAQYLGFDSEGCEADMEALINHQQPCILHVVIENNLQHYVLCFGTIQQNRELRFVIGDPAKGIEYITKSELGKIWQSKTCLVLLPNENFKTITNIINSKRKWIIELVKQDFPLLSIAAALGLAMAIFSQRLIDDILPKKNLTKLNLGIALVFALLLIKEGLSYLRQFFLLRQSKDFNIRIIDFFFSHLLQLPKPFFDTRKIGEFTARLNDTARIQRVISQLAGNVVIDVLVTLVTIIFLLAYSWKVAIICLFALPVYFFLIYKHNRSIIEKQRSVMSSYAMAEANYISTLQGIEPIKNHNKQDLFAANNKKIYEGFQGKILLLGKVQIRLSFLANSFGVVFLITILFFTSYQVLNDHLKIGELIAVLGMCSSLLPSVANLALVSIPISEAKIAFDRMFEFTSIQPEAKSADKEMPDFNSIKVQHLSFRFAGRRQILKNISFDTKKGEIIAIMGENGCGKSTVSQILQKYYSPGSGSIIINSSQQLSEISFLDWRSIISIVPQGIHIFNGTVLENIAFEDAAIKPNEVISFLEQSGFSKFIDMLPQSFMTLVGEEGINLSGGQKQMIALARALYHKPQLLILDEATAAMDRHSEQFVLALLLKLKEEMGVIFITHRLHVLKNFCDRIYILENGSITSSGNHYQLLQTQNLYSNYWADLVS
jgi:ABC-type bacteriocin/lantibiotic exporter with double-glycine peptidase domain